MKKLVTIAVIAAIFATGCETPYSANTYNANRTGITQNVSYGVITNIRPVEIQAQNNVPYGAVAGAVLGGVLGHAVGGGTGKKLATVGGVVAGGLAGNAIQTQSNKTHGMEVEIRLDNGQTIANVQQADNTFQVGSRVRIVDAGGRITVSPVSNTQSAGYQTTPSAY